VPRASIECRVCFRGKQKIFRAFELPAATAAAATRCTSTDETNRVTEKKTFGEQRSKNRRGDRPTGRDTHTHTRARRRT
jgi:hypothetical protein